MPHPWKHARPGWTGLWASWSRGRCPCSSQGGWTRWSLKVLSNPNYSMTLWNWCSYEATMAFSHIRNKFWAVTFLHPWQVGLGYRVPLCHSCTCVWAVLADVGGLSAGHKFSMQILQLASCALSTRTNNFLQESNEIWRRLRKKQNTTKYTFVSLFHI